VHGYTFLFMLPALLTIRRDAALLIAGLFLGDYMAFSWWSGVIVTTGCMLAMNRWTWLRLAEAGPRAADLAGPAFSVPTPHIGGPVPSDVPARPSDGPPLILAP